MGIIGNYDESFLLLVKCEIAIFFLLELLFVY